MAVILAVTLSGVGCGGDDSGSADDTTTATTTPPTTTTTTTTTTTVPQEVVDPRSDDLHATLHEYEGADDATKVSLAVIMIRAAADGGNAKIDESILAWPLEEIVAIAESNCSRAPEFDSQVGLNLELLTDALDAGLTEADAIIAYKDFTYRLMTVYCHHEMARLGWL